MKVCIYGAGAIGGFLGTRLALAGHASSARRAAQARALREFGWRLQTAEGPQTAP
jgi:2-dehydropantoate 2-reductase